MAAPRIALLLLLSTLVLSACKDNPTGDDAGIDITFPEDGSLQRNARLLVRGTAENVDQLEIDGVVAEVVGGEWEALVPVEQGEVTLTAKADGVTDTVTFTVDSIPPIITVTEPERGLYRDASGGDKVMVRGTVADTGTGLEFLKIGEQIIRPTAGGAWQWEYTLEPGLNEINVVARDVAGNESDNIRGAVYGEYIAPDSTIEPGFDIWVADAAMPVMEEVIEGFLTPENLMVMAAAFENDSVKISSIELAAVDATLKLKRGAIETSMVLTNVAVAGTFTLSGVDYDISVEASRLGISTDISPFATPEGLLDITFSDPVLELRPEDLSYDIGDLSDEDNQFLEGLVLDIAREGFGWVLSQGFFAAIYDADILNRKISVFGKEIAFEVAFNDVDVFNEGILVRTAVTMPVEKWPEVRDAPGALNRVPGPSSGYDPTGQVAFSVTENMLDRLLHGVWHSGLLHYQLDSAAFAGFDLPVELTASALSNVIDSRISDIAGPNTPAALRLRPMFPPISKFDVEGTRLLVQLGEVLVDLVLLPPGEPPMVIATISAFLDLSVGLSIVEGIVVRIEFDTELRADIAEEPILDLDDEAAETFLEDVIAFIPQVLAAGLDLRGEADITWLTLSDPSVYVHGVNDDYATVNLSMTANPQTLDPFEPPMTNP